MGFVSSQWLNRGRGARRGAHSPIPVSAIEVVVPKSNDDWSEEYKVVVEMHARRENGEYQAFYLTRAEAETCAGDIVNVCSGKVREQIALQTLKSMTAKKLLKTLTSILSARLRDGPNRVKR